MKFKTRQTRAAERRGRLREQRRGNATKKFAVLFPGLFDHPL
ncbi:hypothetical protein [Aneurinibacillus migulanus]|nr:hypothetical protein [Aneurinibacillus migulanus]MED0893601.1 hypothetical protein [Aneurinibacillus migulanus]MED1617895.1 hypothetical protein [Aneurinibacillus migulanus]MED4728520.1 hypothetical protein [Aneurinibacillus migulanus]